MQEREEENVQALDDRSYVLWRPIPLDFGPDLPRVRHSEAEGAFEVTHFAVVVAGYLSNLRDPILGVRLEVSGVRILPGRHDQDAGVGIVGQVGMRLERRSRTRHRQKNRVRCLHYPRLHEFINQDGYRRCGVEYLSPRADLKVFDAVNSSSVGPTCFWLRVVRFLGSPNGRRLRRGLAVCVGMVGSDRGWTADFGSVLAPAISHSEDSRLSHVSHTLLFTLNFHLTECFSAFCSASPGKISPPSSSPIPPRPLSPPCF